MVHLVGLDFTNTREALPSNKCIHKWLEQKYEILEEASHQEIKTIYRIDSIVFCIDWMSKYSHFDNSLT